MWPWMAWSPTLHTSCRSELELLLDTEPAAQASSSRPAPTVRAAHADLFYCFTACTLTTSAITTAPLCVVYFLYVLWNVTSWISLLSLTFQRPSPSPARTVRLSWLPYPLPWPSSSWQCCSTSWLAGLSTSQSHKLPLSIYTIFFTTFYFSFSNKENCHNAQSSPSKNPAICSRKILTGTRKNLNICASWGVRM